MEEYSDVRKIVEIIFAEQGIHIAEMTAPNSSVPPCFPTRDFTRSVQKVLSTKKLIVRRRWHDFFNTHRYQFLTSHVEYLTYIMVACQLEYNLYQNVFEGFISMCAVLDNLSKETLAKTGMNFCALNSDIIMAFYDNRMKRMFCKCGGIQQLVEYIRGHRYLNWDIPSSDKVKELSKEASENMSTIGIHDIANAADALFLVPKVLETTKAELPDLLSKRELVQKLVAYRLNEIQQIAEVKGGNEAAVKLEPLKEIDDACTNSNSDIETSHIPKQKEDIAWYESIILAVKRCNHSISSRLMNSDNSIQKKSDRILEQLKDRIESLIEVLDEYDEE